MTHATLGFLLVRAVASHNAAVSMRAKLSPTDPTEAQLHALAVRICERYDAALVSLWTPKPPPPLALNLNVSAEVPTLETM